MLSLFVVGELGLLLCFWEGWLVLWVSLASSLGSSFMLSAMYWLSMLIIEIFESGFWPFFMDFGNWGLDCFRWSFEFLFENTFIFPFLALVSINLKIRY